MAETRRLVTTKALRVIAGDTARRRLEDRGWDPELFSVLLGASGGPKWLVLSGIDRVLFGGFLLRRRSPLHTLGTSIGAWRHVCLAQDDPVAAIGRLEERYIHQRFAPGAGPADVTAVGREMLDHLLGDEGAGRVTSHPTVATNIAAVRGRGPAGAAHHWILRAGLGAAVVSNTLSRRLLATWFQRVVFSTGAGPADAGWDLDDFGTVTVPLTRIVLPTALLASGSIPLVLDPVVDPPGAPPGRYWDGGVIDYHHDLTRYHGDGLVLYPHFFAHVVPGWFDKPLRWRWARPATLDRVVMLVPSEAFVRSLPGGRVPDRTDFERYETEQRFATWWDVVRRCEALAEEMQELLASPDPVASVESFGEAG